MNRIEIVSQDLKNTNINALDIYQVEIVNIYNQAINIAKIRQTIYFLCRDKGYCSNIERKGSNFFLSFTQLSLQCIYQDRLIFMVKQILRAYHERKVLKLSESGRWWEVHATIDCGLLSHNERGILTKILKQENKRLATLGIKSRRQKRRYARKAFEENFSR